MQITFIGCGNMACAIIGGLIRQKFNADSLRAVEIVAAARTQLERRFGVATYASVQDLPDAGDVVVLAVKPQQMRAALQPMASRLKRALVLSIAAGIRIADLSRWLGGYERIIRCMPNTPARIAAGITAACAAPGVTAEERAAVEPILHAMGKLIWVENEALLDAVTAVSGSGPAYVFYFIEALRDAAQTLGLSADAANVLAIETFAGAAQLAAQTKEDVALLRKRVTSKGGTTEAALESMAADKVKEAIARAVSAADARSRELGAELGKD
jgi:pyrroline-5-carboxylate reductase